MTIKTLPGPHGLFNVSETPRHIRDSSRVGWQGALLAHIVSAPTGSVDQGHERLCMVRTLNEIELRDRPGNSWRRQPAGIATWQRGDEQREDWRGRCRAQFLFIETSRIELVLDGRRWHGSSGRWPEHAARLPEMIYGAMDADLAQGSPAGSMVGDGLLVALIGLAAGLPQASAGRLLGAARQRVIDYVEAHLCEPLSLGDLAGVAGVGVRHFSRAFQGATGEAPHQYVIGRRVARAMALIAQGLSLVEVAQYSGFADQSQLTRTFTRRLGITPARYRATLAR
jgi:AraC-like DNA-binding protein